MPNINNVINIIDELSQQNTPSLNTHVRLEEAMRILIINVLQLERPPLTRQLGLVFPDDNTRNLLITRYYESLLNAINSINNIDNYNSTYQNLSYANQYLFMLF